MGFPQEKHIIRISWEPPPISLETCIWWPKTSLSSLPPGLSRQMLKRLGLWLLISLRIYLSIAKVKSARCLLSFPNYGGPGQDHKVGSAWLILINYHRPQGKEPGREAGQLASSGAAAFSSRWKRTHSLIRNRCLLPPLCVCQALCLVSGHPAASDQHRLCVPWCICASGSGCLVAKSCLTLGDSGL